MVSVLTCGGPLLYNIGDREEKGRSAVSKIGLYLIYFCAYSFVLMIIGKGSLRGGSSLRDYFICDRSVSLSMCVCTFTGTWVSAITILSLTGSVYEDGISALVYSALPWFLGAFLLAAVAKRIHASNVITVPEFFRVHYDSRGLQCIYGVVFMVVYVLYLVSQYKGFGMVASEIFDIPYPMAVGMVYLFILYTTMGGYRTVVRTDVFNLILLVVSLAAICGDVVSRAGGLEALFMQAGEISGLAHRGVTGSTEAGGLFTFFSDRYTPLVSISMFCGWGLGLAANPQYVVRLLGAKDGRTARNTVLCSLVVLTGIISMLVVIGLGMRVLVPTLHSVETTDSVFVHIMNNDLYSPWSGFLLFSVIGACISTANSQLLLIASSVSYDIVNALVPGRLTGQRQVNLGRLSILVCGTFSMLLTLNPPEFTLSYGGDIWGVVSVLLFPPLYGTLFQRKITRRGVWSCVITGLLSIAAFYPPYHAGTLSAHPAMFGVVLSSFAMELVSALDRKRGGDSC